VDRFFADAQGIFETALAAPSHEGGSFGLMIRQDGGIHVVMDTPFTLEAMVAELGARTAFRVARERGGVKLEGFSNGRRCSIESPKMSHRAPELSSQALYSVVPRPQLTGSGVPDGLLP
jgi:hypothetical protein